MIARILKRASLGVILLLTLIQSGAQDLTGIWRGYFVSMGGVKYKFELQLNQSSSNTISGVSYSYESTRFYGKATLSGNFNKRSKSALIQEIRTTELKMDIGSSACIMKCRMQYSRSGKEEFLEGVFSSIFEKTDSLSGVFRGENCGGGRVYLRKVPSSDFYVEPFLRERPNKKNQEPLAKTTVPKKTVEKPVKNTSPAKNNTVKTPPKPNTESAKKIETNKETNKPAIKKPVIVPQVLKSRQNELVKTIFVTTDQVVVRLYDNGEIDDDTVSVYLDKQLVLSKKRLTMSPLEVKLQMDENNGEHELVMVAENLGRIPPNTSLMIVHSGDKRYEVRITSTEQKNAVVRFVFRKQD